MADQAKILGVFLMPFVFVVFLAFMQGGQQTISAESDIQLTNVEVANINKAHLIFGR